VIAELTDWVLFLHILAAIVWLGGLVMLGLLATLVLRSRDGGVVTRFVGSLRVIGPVVLAPARTAIGAQRAADAGDDGEAARQLRRWSWGTRLTLLLLIVASWDMVFKPGL
jgi:hypothetical protein